MSFYIIHTVYILKSTHKPTYAFNKTHSEAIIKLLHISAQGCHHQGFMQNKGVQGQQLIYVLCVPS